MDGDLRILDRLSQLGLDGVANGVSGIHCHGAGHHKVKVDKGHLARLPGANVMSLQRALGIGRDHLANGPLRIGRHGHIHQPAHAVADHRPA